MCLGFKPGLPFRERTAMCFAVPIAAKAIAMHEHKHTCVQNEPRVPFLLTSVALMVAMTARQRHFLRSHINVHARTHIHTPTHIHTQTQTQIHAYMQTHTYGALTQTQHAHALTQDPPSMYISGALTQKIRSTDTNTKDQEH